jgi:site-specific DNA-methyltransferase (adenine-specific)
MLDLNRIYNTDCMDGMAGFPDGYFDLAVVDPPYFNAVNRLRYYGKCDSTTGVRRNDYHLSRSWEIPKQDYFDELVRVSKNQIIWGVNYFDFQGLGHGRIVWDKRKNESCTFSDGEIAQNPAHSNSVKAALCRRAIFGVDLEPDEAEA